MGFLRCAFRCFLVAGCLLAVPPASAADEVDRANRALVIEDVTVSGNTRTSAPLVVRLSGLSAGAPAVPSEIVAAADRLRERRLFRRVEVHTRPGSAPGKLIVVFDIEENRPHVRLGAGYEDLSGWYLIPLQLNLDNLFGKAEELRLSTRFGYRVAGLELTAKRADAGDRLTFRELRLGAHGTQHVYFVDRTEIAHTVEGGELELRLGRRLRGPFGVEVSLASATFEPDSSAEVHHTDERTGATRGDPVPFEDLPEGLRDDLVRRKDARLGLSFVVDSRRGTALETRGVWGRAAGELSVSNRTDFATWLWDLRVYAPLRNGMALAARTRAGAVSPGAPFYERFYLGGLYTVRGYPSQSLSPPSGTARFAAASLELRAPLIGSAARPALTAIVFLDGGIGWDRARALDAGDGAAGFGYGVRARVPFLGQLGLDVGFPLSPSPRDESFHVNGVIGWTF